jgi:hypothetical protein
MIDNEDVDEINERVLNQLATEGRTCPTDTRYLSAITLMLDLAGMGPERIYVTLLYAIDQLDADLLAGTDGRPHPAIRGETGAKKASGKGKTDPNADSSWVYH